MAGIVDRTTMLTDFMGVVPLMPKSLKMRSKIASASTRNLPE
jgi:hypothetical protein